MTLFAIFPSANGVTNQLPVAMFKEREQAQAWAKPKYGEQFRLKEIEITRCDVVERTGLVRG